VALVEGTNVSVGRGSAHAFQVVGAPFLEPACMVPALEAAELRGVKVAATRFRPLVGPYHGESLSGVSFELLDPYAFSAAHVGLALIAALDKCHHDNWDRTRLGRMVAHRATLAALADGALPAAIEASWGDELAAFSAARAKALLY
jgi:uncharacterized protein YbbC (DUF1343 family)